MDLSFTFNCNGKVNCNDWRLSKDSLYLHGEVDNVFYPRTEHSLSSVDVELFDRKVPAATVLLNLKHYIKCMDMQLKVLNRHEKNIHLLNNTTNDNIDFYYIRRMVCEFLFYIRIYLNSIKWDLRSLTAINPDLEEDFSALFATLKRFCNRLRNIPDSTFFYAPSALGNKSEQPAHHTYHMHIELRWLFITLVYTHNTYYQYSMEHEPAHFENIQGMIVSDLIYISFKIFETTPLTELHQKTPYNCTCIRELWLMLQVFIDTLSERVESKAFWDYINNSLNEILSKSTSTNASIIFCKNPELFSLWMIHHLSLLYGYNTDGTYLGCSCSRIRPNYEQVEKILKTYVSKGGKDGERVEIDEELSTMIPMLNILTNDWWQPRSAVISLLWDCFHKRLDEPFLLQTSGPWTLSVERKSPVDILKQVRDRINNLECIKESSYGMFLRVLGFFLRKNYSSTEAKHWNQVKGRIYSKFSKSKVQEFSVTGLYNFISLFITLAVTADTANVCTVMLDLLPQITEYNAETSKKYNLIWKGKLIVLLLYNEFNLNFNHIATTFVDTVNAISCRKDDTSRSMMANFVDVFNTILSSTKKVELGEHLFVGGWIDRYLLECPNKMVGTLLRALVDIFEKCVSLNVTFPNLEGPGRMIDALWCHVACRVRQLVFDPILISDHHRDVSKLAVAFTLEALRDPATAKKHRHSAVSLFQHFASPVIVKDIRITRHYVVLTLKQRQAVEDLKKKIKNFDTVLIQAWVKCSILGCDENKNEIKIIQDYILELDEIKQMFLTFHDVQEFQGSSESILVLIMCCMMKRNTLKSEQERMQYDTRWRQYFNHIEKWILAPITEESKDSDIAFWIYRCIGTLILCTSPILHTKNQPNNIFRALLNKTVLPTEPSFIQNLGKKIFSMILLGIETLNPKSDLTLQSLIRDLFNQYLPHLITTINSSNNFKVSDVLLKCFKDAKQDFLRLIFEMLMSNFFTISSDNTMHKHSYLIMILLQNLLKGDKDYAHYVTELIVTICTPHIVGSYMKVHEHHPHKEHTISFINNVVTNPYYKEHNLTRANFNNAIASVVQRFLTTNQQSAFEFMHSVSSIRIDIIQFLAPQVERTLTELERYRRPNAASLRYSWNQLQSFMRNLGRNLQ